MRQNGRLSLFGLLIVLYTSAAYAADVELSLTQPVIFGLDVWGEKLVHSDFHLTVVENVEVQKAEVQVDMGPILVTAIDSSGSNFNASFSQQGNLVIIFLERKAEAILTNSSLSIMLELLDLNREESLGYGSFSITSIAFYTIDNRAIENISSSQGSWYIATDVTHFIPIQILEKNTLIPIQKPSVHLLGLSGGPGIQSTIDNTDESGTVLLRYPPDPFYLFLGPDAYENPKPNLNIKAIIDLWSTEDTSVQFERFQTEIDLIMNPEYPDIGPAELFQPVQVLVEIQSSIKEWWIWE